MLFLVTNRFDLTSEEISEMYRRRWAIETFFKWMKQHLQNKHLYGTFVNQRVSCNKLCPTLFSSFTSMSKQYAISAIQIWLVTACSPLRIFTKERFKSLIKQNFI
ncbi:hypothetical protein GCM10010911_07240 [Paenibacillus nasutitermitis]|uniref:Transposase IS4-like domain-containing protein n=1 Tax=Paenibacillus nasutitermitis TaxID=1652958 RepID=A0A916YM75_9BACL|nr:transposase [Paenibacillus nasutitermitis]GGD52287.1 hypothetical protein GCM10010911_07240 [Paenibacillus nasutitermitis]